MKVIMTITGYLQHIRLCVDYLYVRLKHFLLNRYCVVFQFNLTLNILKLNFFESFIVQVPTRNLSKCQPVLFLQSHLMLFPRISSITPQPFLVLLLQIYVVSSILCYRIALAFCVGSCLSFVQFLIIFFLYKIF